MAILKQSTAYTRMFLLVSSSDHIAGATVAANTLTVELSKAGAAGVALHGTVAIVDSSNLPGIYKLNLDTTDTNTIGDLAVAVTAATCDPSNFVDQVQSQVFTDLSLASGTGRVFISSAVQQNTSFLLPFIMTVAGVPTPGLTGFTAQRALAGGGFAPCANGVVEIGAGWYSVQLLAADTNASVIEVHITQGTADPRDITIYTQP